MRHSQYQKLAKSLEALDDAALIELLQHGSTLHSGLGGTSLKVAYDGCTLFVKMIPLNDLERSMDGQKSTANLFHLPCYYQYGVGSMGFSAWRELSSHFMSTQWVLANENQQFPLLYHYRIIKKAQVPDPTEDDKRREHVVYWGNSVAIEKRWQANRQATHQIALILEFIPETLNNWLYTQAKMGDAELERAIQMVETPLFETVAFMNAKELLHFDAHFTNILTDGKQVYFADFGLATSTHFTLCNEEKLFFSKHHDYDRSFVAWALTKWILSYVFGREDHKRALASFAHGNSSATTSKMLSPYLSATIKKYAPIAYLMNTFLEEMVADRSKKIAYPADELELLWNKMSSSASTAFQKLP